MYTVPSLSRPNLPVNTVTVLLVFIEKLYVGFHYMHSITVLFRKNVFVAGGILVFSYSSIKIIFICTHKWGYTYFTS